MKAVVKEIFCMEWELGREIILDESRTFSVVAHVGPEDSEVSESFTMTICNTDFVRGVVDQCGVFNSMWHFVMNDPAKDTVQKYIIDTISRIEGKAWSDCVEKLRLIGHYEFDEYQPN